MIKDKIKRLLSKINSLTDDDEISLLEKDLVKSYVRDLYELIAFGGCTYLPGR